MHKHILTLMYILFEIVYTQKPYRGAEYRTINTFQYGRFEGRMKTAGSSGVVSSFFTIRDFWAEGLSDTENWSEIDFEGLGNQNNSIQTNIITAYETHHEQLISTPFNPHAGFNNYAFEWTPDYISFFINDSMIQYDSNSYIGTMNYPQKIMMNIWQPIWENWVGEFDESSLPVYAFYDWVKYYSYTPGSGNYGSENNFSFEWADDFNSFDESRWQKATHTWSANNAQFIQENAVFLYGHLILCLTDDSTSGYNPNSLGNGENKISLFPQRKIILYPNPFNSVFSIQLNEEQKQKITKIVIFDINGKVVMEKNKFNFDSERLMVELPRRQVSSGLYFISISYSSRKDIYKITYLE
ncbi:MAG: hypothetical protein CMG74_10000 [Candidatus Marinimicrobia bacterium]|nr:hypothetical protein [Candidatus Neomarinimicrobiota bacterium]